MVYKAKELLLKLKYLTLTGVADDGRLEWIGTSEAWNKAEQSYDRVNIENEIDIDLE